MSAAAPSPPSVRKRGRTSSLSLHGPAAARDTALVLGAQGLTTLIALGVDSLLFHTLTKDELGTYSVTLALQAVFLILCDVGISLTTVRVGAKYCAQGLEAEANLVFRRALLTRLLLAAGIWLTVHRILEEPAANAAAQQSATNAAPAN